MDFPASADADLSLDELLRGRIRVWQPRTGYRVNVDSLLLAYFVGPPPYGRVIDLGAGSGVIGLALASLDPASSVTLAELQPRVAAVAQKNIVENGLSDRVRVVEVDLADLAAARAVLSGNAFDRVVSSPPYFPVAAGPPVPDESEAISRHELRLTVAELTRAARRLLVPSGRAFIVYPADRLPALFSALLAESLQPIRLRPIHPRPNAPANRILVEAQKGAKAGLVFDPPFFLRDESGGYSPEARIALGESS